MKRINELKNRIIEIILVLKHQRTGTELNIVTDNNKKDQKAFSRVNPIYSSRTADETILLFFALSLYIMRNIMKL